MKLVIIGQGNVGTNLYEGFRRKGIDTTLCSSRGTLEDIPNTADVYIYAVRDNALAEVVNRVHVQTRALHLHTSGTMPIDIFGEDKPHAGILYPFQSFSKSHLIEDFSHIPFIIEARGIDDIAAVYSLALLLSTHIIEANQADRERLHVAGVFVNNFSNQMYSIAEDLLHGTHIPFQTLLPLIDETAQKVHTLSPREAQTGPARRGDIAVMEHHLSLLSDDDTKQIYQLLSQRIGKQHNPK